MNKIKQHSTWPYLFFSFFDVAMAENDMTSFSVNLLIRDRKQETVVDAIVGQAGSNAIWTDVALGQGVYQWQEGDLKSQGKHEYEFKINKITQGRVEYSFRMPEEGFYEFHVYDKIENIEVP